jgi:thiamine phosphate synthase YjbQ (UPF0047 family)
MFWFKKKDELENICNIHDKRERLFFHDIVNLTHGLILFFNQRQSSNKVVSVEEIQMLEREVRTLQSLIKDHFDYKHKNLPYAYDWVSFVIAEISVKNLIQTYLPEKSVQTFLHKDFSECLKAQEEAVVYFPSFYRIMNNLIKNMAEAQASEVHIYFKHTERGLFIETRNRRNLSQDLKSITDKLPRLILEEGPALAIEGLGLESIHHLALECGGKFDFEITNDYWINHIFLPSQKEERGPKEEKKAA